MILSNTVATSVVLNGATSTVNTPADTLAPLGFGVVSNGENWRGWPGPNQPVVPAVTATATTNLDCVQSVLISYIILHAGIGSRHGGVFVSRCSDERRRECCSQDKKTSSQPRSVETALRRETTGDSATACNGS